MNTQELSCLLRRNQDVPNLVQWLRAMLIFCVSSNLDLSAAQAATLNESASRPNILFIMTDDLGYSDLGCYGSEIATPNLDRLATDGLRLSQFYNTAKCHSSRVALLTGQYCIAAGDIGMEHAVTTAEVLSRGGYFTAMTGKWHLKKQPTDFGFERYFGHLSGACNYFAGDKTFRLNGQPWTVPSSDFYTTTANVDYGLQFLQEARASKKPWYLYVAFNAPHAPLHALPQDFQKYAGRYSSGWDAVREARIEKQKQIGLLPKNMTPSPRPQHVHSWESLSRKRRDFESKRMQTLAAMIDRVDQEVGRLIQDLRDHEELENTLIWFVSDNGACPYDRRSTAIDKDPVTADVAFGDSTGWAWARNAPFRYYKQNQYEGGISSPSVIHWPDGLKTSAGQIVDVPSHLIDVLPTLAEISGTAIPTNDPHRELRPISGQSLVPILAGKPFERTSPLHLMFADDRGLRDGDWKAVSFRREAWELYNMRNDRAENVDLATQNPEQLQRMVEQWTKMTRDVLHASPRSYLPTTPAQLPHRHPEWTDLSRDPIAGDQRRKKKSDSPSRQMRSGGIRARRNTTMDVSGQRLKLTFHGEDPGLAIDKLPDELPDGPYVLSFNLASRASGAGELFYTETPNANLPNGKRSAFEVMHDGKPRDVRLEIPSSRIYKLRLDVSGDGAGRATIRDLALFAKGGEVLVTWPLPVTGR